MQVDLPHQPGRDEARRRIANNVHKLTKYIIGGSEASSGCARDELTRTVAAKRQSIEAKIAVEEKVIHVRILLPPVLGMFAGPIEAMLRNRGSDVLLEDHSKR